MGVGGLLHTRKPFLWVLPANDLRRREGGRGKGGAERTKYLELGGVNFWAAHSPRMDDGVGCTSCLYLSPGKLVRLEHRSIKCCNLQKHGSAFNDKLYIQHGYKISLVGWY